MRRRLAALLLVAAVGYAGAVVLRVGPTGGAGEACAATASPQRLIVVVGPGDTLWAIAARHAPEDLDLRLAVHSLRSANSLASALIRVGQELRLPADWLSPR